jgi:hypothetical protein
MLSLFYLLGLALAKVPDQDPNDTTLDGCYPTAANGTTPLNVVHTARTPNGFTGAGRGWNS